MPLDARTVMRESFWAGLRPDPILSVSEWADRFRVLSSRGSAEPGQYRTDRAPYLREIQDSLSVTDPVQVVVVMKGAQLGLTEAGHNWIGYVIDNVPGPMLVVQPTKEMSERNVRQKIDPMIESCPTLTSKVPAKRSRDGGNNLQNKEFPNGFLIFGSANSSASMRSSSVRYLMLDEVDEYEEDLSEQGDPIGLAKARTRAFGAKKKIYVPSTPTVEGRSKVARLFEESDQRYLYVPCPHCQEKQVIQWTNMRFPDGPKSVVLACVHCGAEIPEHNKTWMLENGEWRAHNPGAAIRGYHISSMYSPLGWLSWSEIVEEWQAAQGNTARLKQFVNTILGETWKDKGDAPEWQRLYERREPYPRNHVQRGALFLTAGVDVQKDRLEVEVVGWGRRMHSWSIDYRVFMGDTADIDGLTSPWRKLDAMLAEQWPSAYGVPMPLSVMAVDTGYQTQTAYNWCRKHARNRVMPIKGQDRAATLIGAPKAVDVNAGGRRISRGLKLWLVGTDLAKSELYGWLKQERPAGETPDAELPVGWCHFPEYQDEYFRQLTAEQLLVKVVKGYRRYSWEKTRERNEALDCRMYNRAAAAMAGIDRFTDETWAQLETDLGLVKVREQNANTVKPATDGGGIRWKDDSSFWRG